MSYNVTSYHIMCNVMSSYCQTPGLVFRLGVDFVLPLSQEEEQQEQEEEPLPNSIRKESARRLKFDT